MELPTFPPSCCLAAPCARHYARGYRDAEPCGALSKEDLEKLSEDARMLLLALPTGHGWHTVEAKLARGALAAVALLAAQAVPS